MRETGRRRDGQRRLSKRPRFEKGHRVSMAPSPNSNSGNGEGDVEIDQEARDKEAKRLLKEREAIKRKLEMNKQKRRSSMGRPSLGRGLAATRKFISVFSSRLP
jgi:hypothetical protein